MLEVLKHTNMWKQDIKEEIYETDNKKKNLWWWCCWFFSLLWGLFLRVLRFFFPPQKPTFPNSNSIWNPRATGLLVLWLSSVTLVNQSCLLDLNRRAGGNKFIPSVSVKLTMVLFPVIRRRISSYQANVCQELYCVKLLISNHTSPK